MATRSPASALHLEREMANKLFIQPPKSSIKPQTRNPITQDDIEFKESSSHKMAPVIYTASKTQGIAMGEFAAKSKRSDIFGDPLSSSKASRKFIPHSSSETYIPTVSLKKSEYQPPSRNPITQDSIETYNPAVRTKISESTAFSHLFDGQQEVQRPRDNI